MLSKTNSWPICVCFSWSCVYVSVCVCTCHHNSSLPILCFYLCKLKYTCSPTYYVEFKNCEVVHVCSRAMEFLVALFHFPSGCESSLSPMYTLHIVPTHLLHSNLLFLEWLLCYCSVCVHASFMVSPTTVTCPYPLGNFLLTHRCHIILQYHTNVAYYSTFRVGSTVTEILLLHILI